MKYFHDFGPTFIFTEIKHLSKYALENVNARFIKDYRKKLLSKCFQNYS